MTELSIFVPARNEEENIENVIRRIEENVDINHELVIVDDHSTDHTAQIVEGLNKEFPRVKYVNNPLPAGFANAVITGFKNCTCDTVVPVMGDLCDDLATIEAMFEKINQGYDIVCGCRYSKGGKRLGGSNFKGVLSRLGGLSLNLLLGIPTHDIANAFKMYRREVIENMDLRSTGFEISMEIPLKGYYSGLKITEVPTIWKERSKGKSNFKVFKFLPRYLKLYFWAIKMRIKNAAIVSHNPGL